MDIPSVIYQYSFFRNPHWSRVFAPGDEVQAYHQRVAENFGLRPHFRFGVDVRSEEWDEGQHHWRLNLADGSVMTARFVISAIGPFFDPKESGIKGIESFKGTRVTPSQWLPEHDVRGKRVAVIGTGATGVQLSGAIADDTASLVVFQRTPVYCIPKPDFRIPAIAQWALRIPGLTAAIEWGALVGGSVGLWFLINTPGVVMRPLMRLFDRAGRALYGAYLRAVVKDARVARDLLPSFGPLGNRPTLNSAFPRVFNKPHCDLVTTPIDEVVPEGVRTTDGTVYEADFLITATGFDLFSEPASYKRGRVIERRAATSAISSTPTACRRTRVSLSPGSRTAGSLWVRTHGRATAVGTDSRTPRSLILSVPSRWRVSVMPRVWKYGKKRSIASIRACCVTAGT